MYQASHHSCIQSPKRRVLKNKQDSLLDKDKTMDNVRKHNICNNNNIIMRLL
jgi:hypothetical protein